MGRGRWFRHSGAWGYPYPPVVPFGYPPGVGSYPPVDEEAALTDEAAYLEAELDRITKRLDELKKGQKAKTNAK